MKQEDKDLLLKELSARYPYGVKILEGGVIIETLQKIEKVSETLYLVNGYDESIGGGGFDISQVKLYLRPMSSMTKEEREELFSIRPLLIGSDNIVIGTQCNSFEQSSNCQDWLNSHHFDYRGLIKRGLALVAPKDMYKVPSEVEVSVGDDIETHFGDMKTVVSEVTHKDRF